MENGMRIWVGNLGAYNAGRLVGGWIELFGTDPDDVWEEARRVTRGADEMWVMDLEGFPGALRREMNVGEAIEIAAFFEAALDAGIPFEAAAAWYEDYHTAGEDPVDEVRALEDRWMGEWDGHDEDEAAADYLFETWSHEVDGALGEMTIGGVRLNYYFDWKKLGRDYLLNGAATAVRTGPGTFGLLANG